MLSDAIISLGSSTYTVWRTAEGAYVDGIYAAGAVSEFTIVAEVQDTTGQQLQNPPEAQYASSLKIIFTTTELKTRSDTTEPDRISIDGQIYEVYQVEHWGFFGSTHYRAYAYADTSENETEDLDAIMQTSTTQTWLYTVASEASEYTITIPKAMIDVTYVADAWIVYLPGGDSVPAPDVEVVLDGTQTTTSFKIKATDALPIGALINCFTRDRS